MAKATYVFIISLFLLAGEQLAAQDTLMVPLHIRISADVAGPVGYFINNDLKSFSALGSFEFNEHWSVSGGTGYSHFSVSKESYDYSSKGLTFTLGPDINLLKPKISEGRNFIGFGLHYCLSFYSHETPRMEYTNQWGTTVASLASSNHVGHFIELTPGVRTELFPGVTMGWNIALRMLLSDGTKSNLKPVYMPGFGDCSSRVTTGIYYYISISIPYHTKRIIIKPKTEDDEDEVPVENNETGTDNSVNNTSF
jgi:hypothetical protein